MKHILLIFVLFAFIFSAGCSTTDNNASATQTAQAFSGAVQSLVQTQQAAQVIPTFTAPTLKPPAAAIPAVPAPTTNAAAAPAAGGNPTGAVILDDKFDQLSPDWNTLWVSNRVDNVSKSVVLIDPNNPGWLLFDLKDKGAIAYEFNKKVVEQDVVIDTINQIGGSGQTEVAVTCRANSDLSSWIDFRILYMNEFAIYKYDKKLVSSGQNPFVQLLRAHIPPGLLKAGQYNKIRATCKGKTASLDLNDTHLGNVEVDDSLVTPGMVGIGGIGPTGAATTVWFDFVTVTKP